MEIDESIPTPVKSHVLIVEDHPIVRHGLVMLINNQADLRVSGEAESIAAAIEQARSAVHDVVLVDISLRDGSGLDLIGQLHASDPSRPLVALSMHEETLYGERALRAGARGYVMKCEAMDKLLIALRWVLSGEMFVSEHLAAHFTKKVIVGRPVTSLDSLSDREFEIFRLLAGGMRTADIATKLELSIKTIEAHRANIKTKLGLRTSNALARFMAEWALRHL